MNANISIENLDLSQFDNNRLKDIGDELNIAMKKFHRLLETMPVLIENLSQAQIFLEEKQKQLFCELQQFPDPRDTFNVLKMKGIDALLERQSNKFVAVHRSLDHLIDFIEKMKSLLIGEHVQSCDANHFNALEEILQLLKKNRTTLLTKALIISKQPPAVLNVGDRFETEAKLLAKLMAASPILRIRIINLEDAVKLNSGGAKCEEIESLATIIDNRAAFVENGKIWMSQFKKNPLLKKTVQSWQLGNIEEIHADTTDQKYVLLYEIIPDHEKGQTLATSERIWTTSLPIVLINQSFQYCDAYASILWNREFNDEKMVQWQKLADALKKIFCYLTGATKRELSEDDLQYFRQKLSLATDTDTVSLKRFAKDEVEPDCGFSFWAWLYCICEEIKKHWLLYWEKGYLMGFGSKEGIAEKMRKQDKPLFLLRFSDSQLGALSISRFDSDSAGGSRHTPFLLPTDQELRYLNKLLSNFDQLNDISHFCDKDFNIIDKRIFLDDSELNSYPDQNEHTVEDTVVCSVNVQYINGLWKFIQSPLFE